MELFSLSPRLSMVAALVPAQGRIMEIGCDHGRLSVRLAQMGRTVLATDISRASLAKAERLARTHGVHIELRCADGLEAAANWLPDILILAGMGGRRIMSILEGDLSLARSTVLILQPNAEHIALRLWLHGHGFEIDDEELATEDGGVLGAIRAHSVDRPCGYDEAWQYMIGEKLWAKQHPLLPGWLRIQLRQAKGRLGSLEGEKGDAPEMTRRLWCRRQSLWQLYLDTAIREEEGKQGAETAL